jgi:class 3 adenylate cyclase/tetratricopeptide (TPR) repeat protein
VHDPEPAARARPRRTARYNDATVLKCPACQHTNPDSARYCAQCGTFLRPDREGASPENGERRYVTVLFSDLVGSSSLVEELGPEDYRNLVNLVHGCTAEIVERYGGEISQYLGDGVLALFGYPRAHEDDAARAVAAAVEVQRAVPQCAISVRSRVPVFVRVVQTRAAIHTGLVVIGAMGSGQQRSILAVGDAVIIASRLQELAEPDSMLISGATRRLLGAGIEVEPRGRVPIRGMKAPIDTFRVTAVPSAGPAHDAARRGELTPFIGREEELALLLERWERVVDGRAQVVVVSGEPGIGKSRLLSALRRYVGAGVPWFEFHGSEYDQSSELQPFLAMLERQVSQHPAADPRSRDRVVFERESAAVLRPLLTPSASQAEQGVSLPDEQRRRILTALAEWVWGRAADAPVAIVFEDLQWLDPTTMDLLSGLVTNAKAQRVLLLLTCRAWFEPPWRRKPNELRLVLNPLTRAEGQRLVETIAAERALSDEVMGEVLEKSDGVPLFLEEVTRMLIDSSGAGESIPETLRELLAARLDRLPSRTLDTIRLGAVLGRRFSREILMAVSSKPTIEVDENVQALVNAGILLREADGYAFKHVLLRDGAYQQMLLSTRVEVHGRVAAALVERFPQVADRQPELVAHHFTEAGAIEPAFREWSRAGSRSLRNGAYVEAVHHFQRALELLGRLPHATDEERLAQAQVELRLRKDFGVSLIATQGYTSPDVAANYERALRRSSELNAREEDIPIHVLYGLWGTCLVRGDREATDEFARHFLRVEHSSDPLARHVAHSTLGARAFYRGDFASAMEHCQQAMQLYEPSQHFVLMRDYGYEGGLYSHGYVACILCFTGRPGSGLAAVNEVLDLSTSLGDPYTRAVALGFAACVARERRDHHSAKDLSDELVNISTERHFVMWLGIAHCLRGWSVLTAGDVNGGAEEIQLGLAIWAKTGAKVPGTYLRLSLVEAEIARGNVEGGLTAVEEGMYQARTTLESYQQPEYQRLRGELLRLSGNLDGAEHEIRSALAGARAQGAAWVELRAALSLARLAAAGHGGADAMGPLAELRARLTEGADTPEMEEVGRLLPDRA